MHFLVFQTYHLVESANVPVCISKFLVQNHLHTPTQLLQAFTQSTNSRFFFSVFFSFFLMLLFLFFLILLSLLSFSISFTTSNAAMVSHPPIAVKDFEKHVTTMSANDCILFAQEFESVEPGTQYMCENAELEVGCCVCSCLLGA